MRDLGRWKEAEQLLVKMMETSRAKLGADHPDTATAITALKACVVKRRSQGNGGRGCGNYYSGLILSAVWCMNTRMLDGGAAQSTRCRQG